MPSNKIPAVNPIQIVKLLNYRIYHSKLECHHAKIPVVTQKFYTENFVTTLDGYACNNNTIIPESIKFKFLDPIEQEQYLHQNLEAVVLSTLENVTLK